MDVRRLRLDELRRLITVPFQDPVHYNATVTENISLGDLNTTAGRAGVEAAARRRDRAAPAARLRQHAGNMVREWR